MSKRSQYKHKKRKGKKVEVSKVTVLPETMRMAGMSQKKKRVLKQNLIMDYIRSKPAGTIIAKSKLMEQAGYDSADAGNYVSGLAFIKRMAKNKLIAVTDHGLKKYSFTVIGDSKTIVPPKPTIEALSSTLKPTIDVGWVKQQAIEFSWLEDTDSLRAFIKHLEKEGR